MQIGIIQCNTCLGDFSGNANVLLNAVKKLAVEGANLCVAPAFALCGQGGGNEYSQPHFLLACEQAAKQLAQELLQNKLPPLIVGAVIAQPHTTSTVFSASSAQSVALLLENGHVRTLAMQQSFCLGVKGHLTNSVGVYSSTGSKAKQTVAVAFASDISPVTEDGTILNDTFCWRSMASTSSPHTLLLLDAQPYLRGLVAQNKAAVEHVAKLSGCSVAYINMVGGTDGFVCFGASHIVTSAGQCIAALPVFEEHNCCVNLNTETFAAPAKANDMQELWNALVYGIRDFVTKCGFTKVALGLSGGVDSALVAALAVEALGPKNVHCLLMPSPYSSKGSIDHSLELANKLEIETHTVPINAALAAYESSLEAVFSGIFSGLVEENTQARIRCGLLMAFAARFNALVLNTSNKSEAAVGYGTMYGDMAGGLAVLADVYKTDVYALCRWRNTQTPGVIPEIIITKAPSAELRDNQKDSDSLPEYAELDALLYEFIENNLGLSAVVSKGYDPDIAERVFTLIQRSEFKRKQAPPVISVTSKTFGKGWRMAIAKKMVR